MIREKYKLIWSLNLSNHELKHLLNGWPIKLKKKPKKNKKSNKIISRYNSDNKPLINCALCN